MAERAATGRSQAPLRVVVAGAGIAGLEAAAALRDLAGDRVRLTLIAPEPRFVQRALEPYGSFGITPPPPVAIATLTRQLDAVLVADRLAWVDRDARTVHCRSGAIHRFEGLVLALGARTGTRYDHAITLDDTAAQELRKLTADVLAARVRRVALIAPERMAWPLPLYEAALMIAARAAEHRCELALTLITAEAAPLQAFGDRASEQMATLLAEHDIELHTDALCDVPAPGHVTVMSVGAHRPTELAVDRVLALPELFGPHVRGLPCAPYGFIPIDRFCRVVGMSTIYAAGDGTDYPIKHGGIAAQQAAVAAACIAAAAWADVRAGAFQPTIDGLLLTGGRPRRLSARLTGAQPFRSMMTAVPTDDPTVPVKLAAPYLTSLLNEIT